MPIRMLTNLTINVVCAENDVVHCAIFINQLLFAAAYVVHSCVADATQMKLLHLSGFKRGLKFFMPFGEAV